jgi:hypothetical protein
VIEQLTQKEGELDECRRQLDAADRARMQIQCQSEQVSRVEQTTNELGATIARGAGTACKTPPDDSDQFSAARGRNVLMSL